MSKRSLLLLSLMPFCALADNSSEAQEAKQQIDPDAPIFKHVVVYPDQAFTVYEGEPTETLPLESRVTERDTKLKLLGRNYRFTVTEKEGKVMYGFPIHVEEVVCGDLFIKNGGLLWGHRVMARHLFRYYTMYDANKRSQICEKDNGPCMTRIGAQDYEPDHYFDGSYSEENLSEKEKLRAKLGASLLGKLMEVNKQNSSVTALPAQCTDINK